MQSECHKQGSLARQSKRDWLLGQRITEMSEQAQRCVSAPSLSWMCEIRLMGLRHLAECPGGRDGQY